MFNTNPKYFVPNTSISSPTACVSCSEGRFITTVWSSIEHQYHHQRYHTRTIRRKRPAEVDHQKTKGKGDGSSRGPEGESTKQTTLISNQVKIEKIVVRRSRIDITGRLRARLSVRPSVDMSGRVNAERKYICHNSTRRKKRCLE